MIWVSPCFGFPFSFYISVFGTPGYLPGITSDFMIVVTSVWVYICYLLAGITAAVASAFKSSPMTESEEEHNVIPMFNKIIPVT